MKHVVVVALAFLAGCSKCGGDKAPVDAGAACCGAAASADRGALKRRSVDVRTALIYTYPEYRGTALLETTARMTRVIPGLTDASRDDALKKLRFEPAKDGGAGWQLSQFTVVQTAPETLQISVSMDADHVGHLYIAHTGLSSQEMAMYLPRQLPVGSERFELDLRYSSSPEKCVQLINQAMTLLLGTQQWKVVRAPDFDGGVPDEFVAELTNGDGATVRWERVRGQVHVVYALQTVER